MMTDASSLARRAIVAAPTAAHWRIFNMIHSKSSNTTTKSVTIGTNVFDKAKVITACERTIKEIAALREEEREARIQKFMQPTWLFRRRRTREAALKVLDYDSEYSVFSIIRERYGYQEQMAERIMRVAQASVGDTINLTMKEFLDIEPII